MGTPYWMAPEVISRSLYATEVTTLSSPQSSQKGLGDTWFFYLWSSPELPTKDCPQFLGSRLVSPVHWPLLDGSSLAYDFAATSWPPNALPQAQGQVGVWPGFPVCDGLSKRAADGCDPAASGHLSRALGGWPGRKPTHQGDLGPAAPLCL